MSAKHTLWDWRDPMHWLAGALLLAVTAMCSYAFMPADAWKGLWSEEAAGWAQAVGSVVAIVFATKIARVQSEAQHASAMAVLREQIKVQRYPVLATLTAQAQVLLASLDQLETHLKSREDVIKTGATVWSVIQPMLEDARAIIDRLPAELLPGTAILLMTQLRFAMKGLESDVSRALRPGVDLDDPTFNEFRQHIARAKVDVKATFSVLSAWLTDKSKGHVPHV